MAGTGDRYLVKPWTPMLAAGRRSEDGSSFVISENGTEEADSEIRRICFKSNAVRVATTIDVGAGVHDEVESENRTRRQSPDFRSSESWPAWASLPTRRKKTAILQYFAFARLFRIVTVRAHDDKASTKCFFHCSREPRITEMQITDCDGSPLFDAWLHRPAWSQSRNRWVVETCGNLIFTIQRSEAVLALEKAASTPISFSSKRLLPRSPADHAISRIAWRRWSVINWNGEHFGYLVASATGEAVFLENADKETVGKFVRQCSLTRQIHSDFIEDYSSVCTPLPTVTPKGKLRKSVLCAQNTTWTCVHNESGQRLMRLGDDEVAYFESVQGLSLTNKLLILAGIVMIIGDLQRPASGSWFGLFRNR